MPIENDIQSFKMWASRMGCPLHCIPSDEALNSLFRSRQSILLFNVMERVRPLKEVKTIRQNIFISRMKKISGNPIEKCERGFAPREYQRYCQIKDLEKEKRLIEGKSKEAQAKCNMDLTRTKILQKEKLQATLENLNVKCNLWELKYEDLENKVGEEQKFKEKIIKLIPTKLTSANMSEENASKAITNALNELDDFYNVCVSSSNSHYIEDAKEELWNKLREILCKIPNSSLWNVLMRMKEELLQKIKDLNDFSYKCDKNSEDSENINEFDLQILKTKCSVIKLVGNCLSTKREENRLNDKFTSNYENFCEEVQFKINTISSECLSDEDEIISDYIVQYNTLSYNQGQKDFLVSEIERCKKVVDDGNRLTQDHELLLGSLKMMYSEIEAAVKRTQYEIIQLGQIKEKIEYSKDLLQHLVSEAQLTRRQIASKTKKNLSGESFCMNISTDTLKLSPPGPGLCSTKLDMDLTNSIFMGNVTFRGNTSIMNQNTVASYLPQHTLELVIFKDIPIPKFNVTPVECQMTISPNPLFMESPELLSLVQHCPGLLLRPELALLKLKAKIDWFKLLSSLNKEIRADIQLPEIDETYYKNRLSEQNDELERIVDEIEDIGKNSEIILMKSKKYYNFLLENPLKQFIPSSKLVNNQTYADYDAEYNMYYRMVTSSQSGN